MPSPLDLFIPSINQAVAQQTPDLLITVGDPWMFMEMPALRDQHKIPWLACFPIDAAPLPESWKRWIRAADATVVFSRYAQQIVAAEAEVDALYLPHGVHLATFRPFSKPVCKQRVGVADRFVVGTVAVNQLRKNLPALIEAFAEFARDKPNALLYLHTQINGHWDLEQIIDRCQITDKTRATRNYPQSRGVNDADLVTVYNSFDVFALPTMAEGFGLPLLESQACGVPALATDCSSCTELLPEPWQRVRVRAKTVVKGFEQSLIDEHDLADKLDRFYQRSDQSELAIAAQKFAAGYDWRHILPQWIQCVEAML